MVHRLERSSLQLAALYQAQISIESFVKVQQSRQAPVDLKKYPTRKRIPL